MDKPVLEALPDADPCPHCRKGKLVAILSPNGGVVVCTLRCGYAFDRDEDLDGEL